MRAKRCCAALAALSVLVCLPGWTETREPLSASTITPNRGLKIPSRAAVGAYILGSRSLTAGSSASYRVAVHWASAPKQSGPLPGAQVTLALVKNKQKTELARGQTDTTGNADFRFPVPRVATGAYRLEVAVRSPLGNATHATSINIYPGGRIMLTMDKKLYQPSQVIHIRALALRSMDLKPVARRPIKIQIKDPKDNVVFVQSQKTSRFGITSVDWQLADEINLGKYTIEAWAEGSGQGGRSSQTVEVKRYVLPKFKVALETDRSFYRPGEMVHGTVRARYFFGKPVASAEVALDVRSRLHGPVVIHRIPPCKTDKDGRCTFQLALPAAGARYPGTGEVRILAKVRDTANHLEQGDLSVPLTSRPFRLSLVPENSHLVPGVFNRVHLIAGYPDGRPASKARVRLWAGKRTWQGRTDDLGVATFSLIPGKNRSRCAGQSSDGDPATGSGGMALRASITDGLGQRGATDRCIPVARAGAVLVRPVRSLVSPGQAVEMKVLAAPARSFARRGQVYVDVVKAGQTLATYTAFTRRGKATAKFFPDPSLFGLLELRGYRISRSGARQGTSRMVYVDHPGRLKIKASADKAVYRPGERAHLKFQVIDSRTGDGVQAALGLLALDEAVVAMGGMQDNTPKLFFTLASQARGQGQDLSAHPGGRPLSHWVISHKEDQQRRARAATVLLAALHPAASSLWETNPWKEREQAWDRLAPRLIRSVKDFMTDHSVGRRTSRGWRFVPNLLPRMVLAKAIPPEQLRDPWQRIVRPWHLRGADRSFAFDPLARALAPQKLEDIYTALSAVWDKLALPRERMRKLKRKKWPLILTPHLLARLVEMGQLKPADIIDPWGKPFRVRKIPRLFINPYYSGLVSRYHIHSAGPDRTFGTKDDIGPRGPRVSVHLFGRDSALGADAEDALGGLIGNQIGEAYGVGGLGLVGTGRGGGGHGRGMAYGLSVRGASAGGPGMQARVRSVFPETLLWRPQLITDKQGCAALDVDLADSITTWKLGVTGSSTTGLLGTSAMKIRVFQDFFVDLDLPVAMTQGDRVSLPVSIYNYLKTPQEVTLRLKREPWFKPVGAVTHTLKIGPSQVGVRYFPIEVQRVGRQELTIKASARGSAGAMADAVRRSTLVEPDGVEHAISHSGSLRHSASHQLLIPEAAIKGTQQIRLAIHSGPMSQTITGMESMLRQPHGCFEQTSSTTYPNVLILDYLHRTGQASKALSQRAKKYINTGYQRLISFEVEGGGFSWFGNAPANKILTAYGLMEFADMARVHPVDPRLIQRTQDWLAAKQRPDGTWDSDKAGIAEGAVNHFTKDRLRITAYIAHALRHTGFQGKALNKALRYVRKHAGRAKDAYTLAVLGNLLAVDKSDDLTANDLFRRLWELRRSSKEGLYFDGPRSTLTFGAGKSGRIESTALAALALLSRRGSTPNGLGRVMDTLVASKDSFGSWHSTQATILSLRALLLQQQVSRSKPSGQVRVLVDGRQRGAIRLNPAEDRAHTLDLTPFSGAGSHRINLHFDGQGNVQYQLAGRYWVPRKGSPSPARAAKGLAISTAFDGRLLAKGKSTRLRVVVHNRASTRVEMPLVSLSLPPGFAIAEKDLSRLVQQGQVEKVQRVGNRALLYLSKLGSGQSFRFSVGLRGKYPLRVQARPSVVYEYYRPENRAQSNPHVLQVL